MSELPRQDAAAPEATANRWASLPEPIRIADTITSQETVPARDPEFERDPQTEFLLRNAG
ncbi:MAG: hypothetical protein AAGC49_14050 [Brevundimonas sp.]